jgi:hypothetical protein
MANCKYSYDFLETQAKIIINNLDRKNIFPPLLNDPKRIISQNKRQINQRKKRKRLPNAFFICLMNVQKEVARNGININMRDAGIYTFTLYF